MINLFGLVILIVFVVFAYRTANDYGRIGAIWAVATFLIGFGLQIIVPIILVMIVAIVMTLQGSTPAEVQEEVPAFTLTILGLALSIVAAYLILRFLSRIPDDDIAEPAPPAPPETFI